MFLQQPTLSFFTLKREQITVNCTANVLMPDGTTKPVQAEKKFTSLLPEDIRWRITSGVVRFIVDPLAPTHVGLWIDSPGVGRGQEWNVSMSAPHPFDSSNGFIGFAQLIKMEVTKYKHISPFEDEEYSQPSTGAC